MDLLEVAVHAFNCIVNGVTEILIGITLLAVGSFLVWKTGWKITGWGILALGIMICLLAVRSFYRSLFYDESSGTLVQPGYDHAQ